jgi:phage terminase large subunit
MQTSIVYEANLNATEAVIVNQGGSSSGKTYSILQVLFIKATTQSKQVITIVGQDIPNLKSGALRDAQDIWDKSPELQAYTIDFNKSDRIYYFKNGSIMEFKSYMDHQDAKSGKRDYLFLNEANGIRFDVYNELALRTRKQIYIDYNPNAEFWVHEHLIGKPDVKLIISDHRHNPFLLQRVRDKIEGLKLIDLELWRVYARGRTGKIEGLVFRNWTTVNEIPKEAQFIAAGMDFGFTNDPTTLHDVYRYNGELWVNRVLYETGLTNQDIALRLTQAGYDKQKQIIADSAEPKSIEELRRLGFNVVPAKKGPDSIRAGIDILKRQAMNITHNSTELKRELMNYKWDEKDKSKPIDAFNHCVDGIRYVALNKLTTPSNVNNFF